MLTLVDLWCFKANGLSILPSHVGDLNDSYLAIAMNSSSQQDLLTLLCCVVLPSLIILYYLVSLKRSRSDAKTRAAAPEPAGSWPLIGHLRMLIKPQLLHVTFGHLADRYGPIFTIRLGLRRALVVSNWEGARECFTTNGKVFVSRPKSAAINIMTYDYALFGLAPYGPFWREMRKLFVQELVSNNRLRQLKDIWISEINTAIRELYQRCNNQTLVAVDMQGWFEDLTVNVFTMMVAGKRYFGASAQVNEHEAKRLRKVIKDFLYLLGMFVVSDAIPFLDWLDIHGHKKAMKRTAKEFDDILGRWLEEHKQDKLDGKRNVNGDLIDVMLSVLQEAKLFGYDADTVNKATCLNIVAAGADTTTITLTWALSLLLNNPHTLKKVQDEIDIHVGKDRCIEDSDIEKLMYLQAIVKETMRLYPAGPLSVPHEAIEDCSVSGYFVPTGTRLIVNLSKIQRDPSIWANPSEFQPERFLTTQQNVDVRGQHFELFPFGAGRRVCPGMPFALQLMHLALARLLQGFEFRTLLDAPVDMTESAGITNLKATPLKILIAPPLPSCLL